MADTDVAVGDSRPLAPLQRRAGAGPAEGVSRAPRARAPERLSSNAIGLLSVLPLLLPLAALALAHWTPLWDEAVVAWRAFDMTHGNPTSLGMPSRAGAGTYYPGPVLFWIIAIPTAVAGQIGPLFGSAAVALLSGILTAHVAVRWWGRWAGMALVGGTCLLLAVTAPQVLTGPVWNPWMGLLPFWGSLVVAVAVAAGYRRAWPVQAVLASIAVQSHLMYSAALLLVAVTPLLARWSQPVRRGVERPAGPAAAVGVAAVIVLWLPAVWQQITHDPGNLAQLLRATLTGPGERIGYGRGLSELGAVTLHLPVPSWAQLAGPAPSNSGPAAAGLIVLVAAALAAATFARRNRPGDRRRAAACVVSLVAAAGTTSMFANLPTRVGLTWLNTRVAFLPVGLLVTAVALVLTGEALTAGRRRAALAPTRRLEGITALASLVVAAALAVWAPHAAGLRGGPATQDAEFVRRTIAVLGPPPSPGTPIRVAATTPDGFQETSRRYGLAYALRREGWVPLLPEPPFSELVDPVYTRRTPAAALAVLPAGVAGRGQRLGAFRDGATTLVVWRAPAR